MEWVKNKAGRTYPQEMERTAEETKQSFLQLQMTMMIDCRGRLSGKSVPVKHRGFMGYRWGKAVLPRSWLSF